jgi:uncharacterized repeat protein (TIGR03803 family)
MTKRVSGTKPVLVLLTRLLWAAALALPVLGAQAAVVLTTLYSFTGGNDGGGVNGLVQGSDGNFYGTTCYGGTNDGGTVFKISPSGALTTLYSFGSITNASGWALDGDGPEAALVQGSDGNFYGTTAYGGTNDGGTVFKISPSGALTTLYSFGSITNATGRSLDGDGPEAALVQGSDGNVYGTTDWGGTNDWGGSVFKISTNGVFTSLYLFTGGNDGAFPNRLVQGSDGYLYGTTALGRSGVFKISTNGAFTSLYSFIDGDGIRPSGLVQGSDGNFYGTMVWDGHWGDTGNAFGSGTVFRISTNGAYTTLYSFDNGNGTNGANPAAGLVQGRDGYLYGTTEDNGGGGGGLGTWFPYGAGTVFKISTDGALTPLYSFGITNASWWLLIGAKATLVQASDGSFYGTTTIGYMHTNGTIFRLTIVPEPQLTIIPCGPYVILTWPTNYAGFTLQSTTNLGSSAVWATNSSPPVVIGGQNVVINAIYGRQQFFRLSQ